VLHRATVSATHTRAVGEGAGGGARHARGANASEASSHSGEARSAREWSRERAGVSGVDLLRSTVCAVATKGFSVARRGWSTPVRPHRRASGTQSDRATMKQAKANEKTNHVAQGDVTCPGRRAYTLSGCTVGPWSHETTVTLRPAGWTFGHSVGSFDRSTHPEPG
jgi:hypothetical protein